MRGASSWVSMRRATALLALAAAFQLHTHLKRSQTLSFYEGVGWGFFNFKFNLMFTGSLCGKFLRDSSRGECSTLVRSGVSSSTGSSTDTENLGSPCWEKQRVLCTLFLSLCEIMLNSIEEKGSIKTDHEHFFSPGSTGMCIGEGRIQNSCFSVKSHFPLDRESSPNKKALAAP